MKIGLLIIATNKYIQFIKPLIKSTDQFFFTKEQDDIVEYFIFTDQKNLILDTKRKYHIINIEHQPWPYTTLYRYKYFIENSNYFSNIDYLYYCDADMLFVDNVDREILGNIVGTIHPGFMGGRGTPETNPFSLACIPNERHIVYCAGGFNGGHRNNFLEMARVISNNINIDLANNIIAIWHDESHMNKYYLSYTPDKLLSPSYCYPESWDIPIPKKILALDKNHAIMREIL